MQLAALQDMTLKMMFDEDLDATRVEGPEAAVVAGCMHALQAHVYNPVRWLMLWKPVRVFVTCSAASAD